MSLEVNYPPMPKENMYIWNLSFVLADEDSLVGSKYTELYSLLT